MDCFLKHPYKRFCFFIFFIFTTRDLTVSFSQSLSRLLFLSLSHHILLIFIITNPSILRKSHHSHYYLHYLFTFYDTDNGQYQQPLLVITPGNVPDHNNTFTAKTYDAQTTHHLSLPPSHFLSLSLSLCLAILCMFSLFWHVSMPFLLQKWR